MTRVGKLILVTRKDLNYFFDLVRCLSILGVIASHVVQTYAVPIERGLLYNFFYVGSEGVFSFFFLSGCLMTFLYDKKTGLEMYITNRQIILRRIARIYPLWVAFLFAYIALSLMFNLGSANFAVDVLNQQGFSSFSSHIITCVAFLFFVAWLTPIIYNSTVPGGWSIICEVYHYLFYVFTRTKSPMRIIQILISFNIISLVIVNNTLEIFILGYLREVLLTFPIYQTLFYFILGVFFMKLLGHIDVKQSSIRVDMKSFLVVIYFCFYSLTVFLLPTFSKPQIHSILFCTIVLMLSFTLLNIKNKSKRKLVTALAKYSYFLYFIHFVLISFSYKTGLTEKLKLTLGSNLGVYMVLFLTLIILVGTSLARVSYRFFEEPMRKVIREFV